MNRKRLVIIIVLLAILAATGYFVIDGLERANAKRAHYIKVGYEIQNEAFFGWGKGEYMPYDAAYDTELQIHINAYTRKTGQAITIGDVETFLKDQENPDGSPRTWENDTGAVYDFVNWCADNAMAINDYSSSMQGVLTKYCVENPEFPYYSLYDLNAAQINELDKKLNDPNYELDLENLK